MTIPKLKRIKVTNAQELQNWLAKNANHPQDVMIVTSNTKSRDKYISSEQVRDAALARGWDVGRVYTLNGNLVGHVVTHS